MSKREAAKRAWRVFIGFVAALAAVAVIPSAALAAGENITVSPVGADGTTPSLAAGSSQTLNLSAAFDEHKTPASASFNLAPGLLLNLGSSNTLCLTGTPDFTNDAACQVGSGEIDLNATVASLGVTLPATATGSVFLAPPAAGTNDLATLDVHITNVNNSLTGDSALVLDAPIDVTLNHQTGGLTLGASNLPTSTTVASFGQVNLQITGIKVSLNPTLDDASGTSQPFTRLPTSCGAATSTLDVTYGDGSTGSASDSFTPTDCAAVPFAPSLTASVTADATDNGAQPRLTYNQKVGEAATRSIKFTLPSSLKPNFGALSGGDEIGTVSAASPLLPLDQGTVTLGGTAAAPTLTVAFPAPVNVSFTGSVDTSDNTVTFTNMPDIPLTLLSFDITGANGATAFTTDCSGGNVAAQLIGQGTQIQTPIAAISFIGCTAPKPPPPATTESLALTPSDLTAGGSTTLIGSVVFDADLASQTMKIEGAPGLLANIAANPSCLTGAAQLTTACHIGTGVVELSVLGRALFTGADLFLVPAPDPSKQIAGIEMDIGLFPQSNEPVFAVTLDPSTGGLVVDGALPTTLALSATSSAPVQVDELDLAFDTLNGQPFIRLPSSCGAAKSSFTATYDDSSTGSASGSFTPTACASEAFAPSLSASVAGKGGPGAAEVKLDSTQKAGEAASKSIALTFPSGLKPGSGISGTASVSSPLLAGPLAGKVSESGSTVTVAFPAPFGLTLTGTVSGNTITFSGLPDISLSDLSLDLTSGFSTDCSAGNVTGAFSGQGGQAHTATAPLQISDCTPPSTGGGGGTGTTPTTPTKPTTPTTPTKPTTPTTPTTPRNHVKAPKKAKGSGTVKGLASGHPTVSLKVTLPAGQKARSLTVALPKGLKFSRAAFAKHKVSGLKIGGGAKAASVKLKAGKLVIALKKPVHSLSIKVSGKLVTASGAVAASKHHKPLTLTVRATTTNHKTDTVKIKLTV